MEKIIMKQNEYYSTANQHFAAFLILKHMKVRFTKTENHKLYFFFLNEVDKIQSASREYHKLIANETAE